MRFNMTIKSTILSTILAGATVSCWAQAGQGPQGFAAPAFQGRMGGMAGGVNPIQSHAMELIRPERTDVRSEIHLDIKQKAALDELMNNSQSEIQNKMRQQFQSPELQAIRNLPQDQQRAKMQEFMQANRAQMMADM